VPIPALTNPPTSISEDADTTSPDSEDITDAESSDAAPVPEMGSDASDSADPPDDGHRRRRPWQRPTPPRLGLLIGLIMVAALAALIGLLGFRAYHAHQAAQLRALYLQVGRQGAVNLTTIDWHHADDDVQRILSSATGSFYDDFSQRSAPFVEVVKKVQSVSTGTVTVAGLESSTDNDAQVLVAVNVETTTSDAPQQTPRAWRMRVSVQKVGNDVKVSNVEFVP
jgi:Mce-associated membrane protein